jgi:hypothetical protein
MKKTGRRLSVAQILRWADEHHRRTGSWPRTRSGPIRSASGHLTWAGVNWRLHQWSEPGQPNSLAKLLQARRGVRNHKNLPRLTVQTILKWADAFHRRSGRWPVGSDRESIPEAPTETWSGVNSALWSGRRGLGRKRWSLMRLLRVHRGVRNPTDLPPLSASQVLKWADAHHSRAGKWPDQRSGPIQESAGETWATIHSALNNGRRGLRQKQTLLQFLAKHRHIRVRTRVTANDDQIIRWAKLHYRRTSTWPTDNCGRVHGQPFTWSAVGQSLRRQKDSHGRSRTLSQFLQERLGVRRKRNEMLRLEEVQSWVQAFRRRTGRWPTRDDGVIREAPQETWSVVISAMRDGARGLPPHSWRYSTRTRRLRPRFTVDHILQWARSHQRRTSQWPRDERTAIPESGGRLTWTQVNLALQRSRCGSEVSTTLARLLAERCDVRRRSALSRLSTSQVVAWAKAHHARTGTWPRYHSGPIPDSHGETWSSVCAAISHGIRGLPRTTLQRLLHSAGVRQRVWGSPLTEDLIVEWAKAHHERTGDWPHLNDGEIAESPGRTWRSADLALQNGFRGLKGGTTLARLLERRVGARNPLHPPRLTISQILKWADAHYARTGVWPSSSSSRVIDVPREHWKTIHGFLKTGGRGLPGGSSLVDLLTRKRGARYRRQGLPLTVEQILDWARDHRRRTGQLPTAESGPVRGVPGEHWRAIDASLRAGTRNLRGPSSLDRLFRGSFK